MKKTLVLAAVLLAAGAAQAHVREYKGTFVTEGGGTRSGGGEITLTWDTDGHTLGINATFAGLSGNTTQAHIHCCIATPPNAGIALATQPANNLPSFPLGVQGATYTAVIDLTVASNYGPNFLLANSSNTATAELALMNGLEAQKGYFNIHSSTFQGGEIRAFVTLVPEPASFGMLGLGLLAVGAWARRRRA